MPTYPLAFPSIHPDSVKATRRRVQSSTMSPFTLQAQIFDWGASKWEITIVMQRMDKVDAEVFGKFIDDLGGMVGTFSFNLTPWVPGLTVPPGVRTFRLKSPNAAWDATLAVVWGFQIEAVEVDSVTFVNGAPTPQIVQAGNIALAEGDFTKAIVFPTAFATTPASVNCWVVPPDGGEYIAAAPVSISTTGLTGNTVVTIPGAGYVLHWVAFQ